MSQASDTPDELPDVRDDGEELSIRTIAARLTQRSQIIELASNKALADGQREPMHAVPSPAPVLLRELPIRSIGLIIISPEHV
jgi:hypothetical protein